MGEKLLIFIIFLITTSIIFASEFRQFTPIATPSKEKKSQIVSQSTSQVPQIEKSVVERAVQDFVEKWNNCEMDKILDSGFFDKTRLLESMAGKMQKDAKLKVLSIQDVQVLKETTQKDTSGEEVILTTISATLNTQIEFNDSQLGFKRVDGKNQVIFDITIKPEKEK